MTKRNNPMISRSLLIGALAVSCFLLPVVEGNVLAAENQPPEQTGAIAEVRTRKALVAWESEKKQLQGELEKLENHMERTLWQKEKARTYRETLESKISELRRRAAEMETINAELLPVLDETLNRLKSVVDADLPFEQAERHKRLEQVEKTLSDYDAGLLGKTQAIFDALAREVDIGHGIGVAEGEIIIGDETRQVKLLRVGRVGLYALTMDGSGAYVWNREQNTFTALDNGIRAIEEAIQMSEGTRLAGLSSLPMERPERIENIGGASIEAETN